MEWLLLIVVILAVVMPGLWIGLWVIEEAPHYLRSCWLSFSSWRLRRRGFLPYDTLRQRRLDSTDPDR